MRCDCDSCPLLLPLPAPAAETGPPCGPNRVLATVIARTVLLHRGAAGGECATAGHVSGRTGGAGEAGRVGWA